MSIKINLMISKLKLLQLILLAVQTVTPTKEENNDAWIGKLIQVFINGSSSQCGKTFCHKNAVCIFQQCICRYRYEGDGLGSCTLVPQQRICGIQFCHRKAICIEAKCHCLENQIGDGMSCYRSYGPPCGKRRCHPDATCYPGGKCQCKNGFVGDGVNYCDSGAAMCTAKGDPHYTTFDLHKIPVFLDCLYLMASSRAAKSHCPFLVSVKQEYRSHTVYKNKAFIKSARVTLPDAVYKIDKSGQVLRNGFQLFLPVAIKGNQIYKSESYTIILTRCGLKVRFRHDSSLSLVVPAVYRQNVTGLCGNFNGLHHDDDVQINAKSGNNFMQQYILTDDSEQPSKDKRCQPGRKYPLTM